MDPAGDHVAKTRHNIAALRFLEPSMGAFSDWAITVMFYAALHCVCAVIHASGRVHGTDHAQTRAVASGVLPLAMFESYNRLYLRSRAARYENVVEPPGDFEELRRRDFDPLMAHCSTALGVTF